MYQEDQETKFNMGLANQQHIENLFEKAAYSYVKNEPKTRATCLLQIKLISYSECNKETQKDFDDKEKKIRGLLDEFNNLERKGCFRYDVNTSRYMILKNEKSFELFDALNRKLNELEQDLRIKLAPILFPKTGDKRFALSSRS